MSKKQKRIMDIVQEARLKMQQKGDNKRYLKDLKELREQKDIELFDSLDVGVF